MDHEGGSIPARAGEPARLIAAVMLMGVYPHACGGTWGERVRASRKEGLSPRMRGNPPAAASRHLEPGSIPAHAGEPCPRPLATCTTRVYPRA